MVEKHFLSILSTPFLRSDQIRAEGDRHGRHLSYQHLAGYKPLTSVTDHAKIDYDQAFIERMTEADRMEEAIEMYRQGGYSQSIAQLSLQNPIAPRMPIPEGTIIIGTTQDGHVVKGTLIETATWTSNTENVVLLVEYEASTDQATYCHVGGLALTNAREVQGCFANQGTIKILDFQDGAPVYEYTYTYDPVEDTYNGRTMQGLSTQLDMTFGHSKHFEKFEIYYGTTDYADAWIEAALNGTATDFSLGNANFTTFDALLRKDVMVTAPKVLNLWMYVVRMMEFATVRCDLPCGQQSGDRCDDFPVRAWDQSVAFYTGSLEGIDGQGKGIFLYDLADSMCQTFKTCSEEGNTETGISSVNVRIMNLFQEGQLTVLRRECAQASAIKDQIVTLMTIPLIQASLYSAHVRNFTTSFEEVKSATYAAAVLPIVNECSNSDAETIFSNLGLGQANTSLDTLAVKNAFEKNYDCMGLTCQDIGGVWEGKYYGQYSFPCNYDDSGMTFGIGILVVLCFILIPCILFGLFLFYRKKSRQSTLRNSSFQHGDIPSTALPVATANLD
jgi:hypothetical protein